MYASVPDLTVCRARMTLPGRARDLPGQPWLQAGLEDALRCASRPASFAGHVVVIKRLRVRRRMLESSAELALRIEAAWQALARSAIHYTRARNAHEAVWFDDEWEVRVALIEAWLRTEEVPVPWYCARLETVLPVSARSPKSWAIEIRIARAIAAPLAHATPRRQREFLCAAFARLPTAQCAARVIGAWHESEAQEVLEWLEQGAAGPAVLARGGRAGSVPYTGDRSDTGQDASAPPGDTAHWSATHARLLAVIEAVGADLPRKRYPDSFDATRRLHDEHPHKSHPGNASMRDRTGQQAQSGSMPLEGFRSVWAGLLFLPALIERSNLAARFRSFDRGEMEAASATVLLAAADWLRIDEDDALREALAPLFATASPRHTAFAHTQLRAARLWAVRHLRLPLRRIARRRGRVIATSNRIDVAFPMFDADLRLRRAGIDIDPGWLPWLGLSLHYHFLGD